MSRAGHSALLAAATLILRCAGAQEGDWQADDPNNNPHVWLRCSRGQDIDWPAVRIKFDTYADKYLDAPHLFVQETQLSYIYSHKPILPPSQTSCPLGDLTLRLFMWLSVTDDQLLNAVEAMPSFSGPLGEYDTLQPAAMFTETFRTFWEAPLSWSAILKTGWPIFSVLSQLGVKAKRGMLQSASGAKLVECEDAQIWGERSYLEALSSTFRNGSMLPVHASVSILLTLDRKICSLAFASALLALSDSIRWDSLDSSLGTVGGQNAFYYRYAAVAPLATDGAMHADLHAQIGSTFTDDQDAFLALAEKTLRQMGAFGKSMREQDTRNGGGHAWPANVLLTNWPFWRLLDRLGCGEWAEVLSRPIQPQGPTRFLKSIWPSFFVHVFPHRVSSDGLQSSRIRALRRPYCAKEFQNEFDMLRIRFSHPSGTLGVVQQPALRVVEAGPHLGDCLLWAAARVGCEGGLKATGYDVVHQLVAMFRKSVVRNHMGMCVDARLAFLGDMTGQDSSYLGVKSVTLDNEVDGYVHLLKVHTNGGEDAILRGGKRVFTDPRRGVGVVVLNSVHGEVLQGVVEFLNSLRVHRLNYELELKGSVLRGSPQQISQVLKDTVAAGGSVQLIARRSDLPPLRFWNLTGAPLQKP